jgi:hypothetical protein
VPDHHLIEESAKAPPVHGLSVTFAHHYLRCQVLRSAAYGVGLILIKLEDTLLGEAEISQPDVALGVEQYVFWLQVSVDDASGMESFKA